jgi:formylglycine-generating enzyme required for sulfatase activity
MEHALRTSGVLTLMLLLLAGCKPAANPHGVAAQPAQLRATPAAAQPAPRQGQVSVQGDDALAAVLSWSLPEVAITHPAAARTAARRALTKGDLFETAQSAIPLLLALQKLQPGNLQDAELLEKSRAALLSQAWAALAENEDLASLRYAQRQGTVLRSLWPEYPQVQEYLTAVDRVGQAFDLTLAGEAQLRANTLDVTGGALEKFRKALALWPALLRAQRGLGSVEDVLVAQTQQMAFAGDFDGAYGLLARASQVRGSPLLVQVVGARIEAARNERLRRMRDAGLIALGTGNGLQFAREQLVDMLRIAKPGDAASVALRQRIDLVSRYDVFRPGQVFTDEMPDASRGPSMMVVPFGEFLMGSATGEPDASVEEQPQHRVSFERGFAMGRYEITLGQFRRFVEATGYVPRATQRGHSMAYDVRSGNFVRGSGIDWRSGYDGQPAEDAMPVIHVTARDAEAYAAWLSQQTGAHYRLPSEAEFEYALRAGGQGRFPWGNTAPPAGVENLAGGKDVSPRGRHWNNAFPGYADGWWGPAPVGSFAANRFGLYDMGGNVSEWVADCWHKGYRRAPANGAAWVNPGCRNRMYRGGSWSSAPAQVRSAWRVSGGVDVTNARVGFRLVRQL